jgi:hypothetical protein
MGLQRHAKATPGNLRARLTRIADAAEMGAEMALRWSPKGRYFYAQRQMLAFFDQAETEANRLLDLLRD